MPSPLAHLAAGALIARHARQSFPVAERRPRGRIAVVALFFSLAPDLDTVPGLLAGNIRLFHNQATHSPLFGLGICLLALFALLPFIPSWRYHQMLGFLCAGYGLHLLMDWLTSGRGLKLLWPFSDTRFASPIPLFYGVRYSEGWFSHHHLITLANEAAVIAAVGLGLYLFSPRGGKTRSCGSISTVRRFRSAFRPSGGSNR